ncbi:hypothetical protein [Hymenobacter frigidus]|uniref:hypothetical protein n=1 Tax=Hymenobacter frigidus TaxID=1524095 RepID=UPI00166AC6ED|nr:hypothetical protein [Hymenobacter frigidus]
MYIYWGVSLVALVRGGAPRRCILTGVLGCRSVAPARRWWAALPQGDRAGTCFFTEEWKA